jgi:hypothetical protein
MVMISLKKFKCHKCVTCHFNKIIIINTLKTKIIKNFKNIFKKLRVAGHLLWGGRTTTVGLGGGSRLAGRSHLWPLGVVRPPSRHKLKKKRKSMAFGGGHSTPKGHRSGFGP